jgi:hypothetical protein
VGLKAQIAPACVPKFATEANGINDEESDECHRYGEQRAHLEKSTLEIWQSVLTN